MPHHRPFLYPVLYRVASSHLGEPVGAWIARERRPDEDLRRSWAKIAANLAEATDGLVEVHGSTVARWSRMFNDAVQETQS